MSADWPEWSKVEEIVTSGSYVSGNTEFNAFKKKVLKATVAELDEQAGHAPVMWDFLIGFAAVKNMYRNLIIQVFNKLTQVPSWVEAFQANKGLHEKMKTLHEDLQAALGAQHDVIKASIHPNALKSMAFIRQDDKPEHVREAMAKEKVVDAIREEESLEEVAFESSPAGESSPGGAHEAALPVQVSKPLAALQEGIDAVVAIDDNSKMDSGGLEALNRLRIGCVMCAGQEEFFQREIGKVHEVFSFLLSYTARKPADVSRVAEVMNVLMNSPSWSIVFEASPLLRDGLRELHVDAQAALGLQHEKVMQLVSSEARKKAAGGDVPEKIKGVVEKMKTIRNAVAVDPEGRRRVSAAMAAAVEPVTAAHKDEWKEAKTPEGHSYYYNLTTRESTWERPAAIGGPRAYKAGDAVEVWSNGMRVWGRGKVEKVEGGVVTAEFTLPNGSVAKKELPAVHKDLRPAVQTAQGWTAEEQAAYQKWFASVAGGTAGKPAAAVATFLSSCGLERPALKQVWAVANPGSKTELGFDEFAKCCRLVAHCQAMKASGSHDAVLLREADRPLRVKLREVCLAKAPPRLCSFGQ